METCAEERKKPQGSVEGKKGLKSKVVWSAGSEDDWEKVSESGSFTVWGL
jgi:hypothetical protein